MVADSVVYAVTYDGVVLGWDAGSGAEVFRVETRGFSPTLAAAGGTVYASTGSGLTALDAATGDVRWWTRTAGNSPVTIVGKTLFLTDSGALVALNAATGAELWRVRFAENLYGSPAVVDGVVYIGGDTGVHALG
ncbi:MAG: eukaryotic-like serine/threonine-protein kinase [Thermomicrobiales bacterium]|nr:eukaryotic-like serine/threonine-protein kinase [Thermomicrobiales bacterium]